MIGNISKTMLFIILAALLVCVAVPVQAKVTAEEAARLNKDLTPVGAERAGNEEGTIPAWTGGLSKIPDNIKYDSASMGQCYPDPYADDKILFTITAKNVDQYKDKLSDGMLRMFKRFPDTWKMHVYPTRRSAAYSEEIYKRTYDNALTAEIVAPDGSATNFYRGFLFPIAKNGSEAILNWTHKPMGYAFIQQTTDEHVGAVVQPDGSLQVQGNEKSIFYAAYAVPKEQFDPQDFIIGTFNEMTSPPGRKGELNLRMQRGDYRKADPGGWKYNPGQRRVRRSPNVYYDATDPSVAGLIVVDDAEVYCSPIDRFDWKLNGKKELFVPYNTYKLDLQDSKDQILTPLHPNPDLIRWELHRVYVTVATIREGYRHCYGKRIFYQDEDSWLILLKDQYDTRGELWRMTFVCTKQWYDVPVFRYSDYFNFDFQLDRYFGAGLINKKTPHEGHEEMPLSFWTVENLRKMGLR